jgi:hypothetical protein
MHAISSGASRRWVSVLVGVLVVAPIGFSPKTAHAQQQVSDADRNAARDLYVEAETLRQQGRYADALDRYQRSLAVFPAPTTAFRVAQCKAALGQLVEAAEELRAVANAALPPNASEAYIKAKQEAATELQSVEPRIPKLKINVQPSPLAGLSVTIDGAQMPVALIGVARPVNPGSHRIVAVAPGYAQAQAQVDVREKQQPIPEITLTLQQGGGVSYTTAPPNTNTGGTTGTTYQGQPPQGGGYQGNAGYGGSYSPYGVWIPPRRRPLGPSTAFMIGVDVDAVVPVGTWGAGDINNGFGVGFGFGVDIGFRLARFLYLGAILQPSFYGGNESVGTSNGFSLAVSGILGFLTNPEGVGFYLELGGGYRMFSLNLNSGGNGSASGYDVILGLGVQIKAGWFRFIPKVEMFAGGQSDNQNGQSDGHAFFNFALAGFWEKPLDAPVAVAVQPAY